MDKKNSKKTFAKGLDISKPVDHPHDLHFHRIFGAASQRAPSQDFYTGTPLKIKNQGPYNFCPAFAKDAVMEDETNVELDPLYSYATACELLGSVQVNGMSLRDIGNQEIKVGAIEATLAVYTVEQGQPATLIADWHNYPESLKAVAYEHQRATMTRVDTGPFDTFDNILSALYKSVIAGDHKSILTGVGWRESWTHLPNGVITTDSYDPSEPGDGHAIKIFGQHIIAGKQFVIIQNSWGEEVGDKGLFYMDRETVNKELVYGAYNFPNISPTKAKFHSDNNVVVDASLPRKFIAMVIGVIKSWLPKL